MDESEETGGQGVRRRRRGVRSHVVPENGLSVESHPEPRNRDTVDRQGIPVKETLRVRYHGALRLLGHGSLEHKLGPHMSCSRETKCIAVFYDVCRFQKCRWEF